MPRAMISGFERGWLMPAVLMPAVLMAALVVLAALALLRPGIYLVPAFTGYLCFLLVGYAEAQFRAARRPGPAAAEANGRDEWRDHLRRLDAVVASLADPKPPRPDRRTLH
jgi:hypothetical protein